MSNLVIYEDKENVQNVGFTSPPTRKLKNTNVLSLSSPKTPKAKVSKKDDSTSEKQLKEKIAELENQLSHMKSIYEDALSQELLVSQPARIRKIMALSLEKSALIDSVKEKDDLIEQLTQENKLLNFKLKQSEHEIQHLEIAVERASTKTMLQQEPKRIRKIMQLSQEKNSLEEQLTNMGLTSE